jgi:hypothetical protein
MSPFEGEMRRRAFSTVQTFELLLSFQAGLPAIIHEDVCDTEPPSNLYDLDFDEHSSSLPPSRPLTDPTPMLYYCYKGRVATVFRKIARQALSPRLPPHSEVMQLDTAMRQVMAEVPPPLVWKPLNLSLVDEPYSIMHRLNLELTMQKCMMILHRSYLTHDRLNPAYTYSREACRTASLLTLQRQSEVHEAMQVDGILYNDRWSTSSIALHDFLLAGMITCLDLYEGFRQSTGYELADPAYDTKVKQQEALRTSEVIWATRKTVSSEEKRAAEVLKLMLSKLPDLPLQRPSVESATVNMNGCGARTTGNGTLNSGPNHLNNSSCSAVTAPTDFVALDDFGQFMYDPSSDGFLNALYGDSDMLDWVSGNICSRLLC